MFSAKRGQDFRRDRYEPLLTVAHAPSNLPLPMHYTTSNVTATDKLWTTHKEVVVTCFKPSQNLPGGTEESDEIYQS
jgi:hypothetical protein